MQRCGVEWAAGLVAVLHEDTNFAGKISCHCHFATDTFENLARLCGIFVIGHCGSNTCCHVRARPSSLHDTHPPVPPRTRPPHPCHTLSPKCLFSRVEFHTRPHVSMSRSSVKRKRTAETDGATGKVNWDELEYQTGFGNSFETEALEGALPKGQNNPQRVR